MKRIASVTLALWLMCLFAPDTDAQSTSGFKSYMPPSPNAMTFQRYADHPVDYSTGVPNISVPLYTIALKDYSLPISVSFHAGGRRASLDFSSLGLNWALQAGGVISRELRGRPDGTGSNYNKSASYYEPQASHYDELLYMETQRDRYNAENTLHDTEYDVFTISMNGISGKFILKDGTEPIFLTYFPYKVSVTSNFGEFTVTDDAGVKYEFGGSPMAYGFTESANAVYTNSWFIKTITTPTGSQLKFKYNSVNTQANSLTGSKSFDDMVVIMDDNLTNRQYWDQAPGYKAIERKNMEETVHYFMGLISSIEFDQGKVTFEYDPVSIRLNTCKITNPAGDQTIRKIDFSYLSLVDPGYSLPNNNSISIKNISFKDGANVEKEKYSFTYYAGGPQNMPAFAKGRDWWGYSNGTGNEVNRIPVYTTLHRGQAGNTEYVIGCQSCRTSSFGNKQAGMLKKIYYPTGGNTEFIYESNRYATDQGSEDGPGIRVKEIISHDALGNKLVKSYKYGANENGIGYLDYKPSKYDFYSIKIRNFGYKDETTAFTYTFPQYFESYRVRTYTSEPSSNIASAYTLPVYYNQVTEYQLAANGTPNGRTRYLYTTPSNNYVHTPLLQPGTNESGQEVKGFTQHTWSTPQLESATVEKYRPEQPAGQQYEAVTYKQIAYDVFRQVDIPQVSVYRLHEFPHDDNGTSQSGFRKMEYEIINNGVPLHPITGPWKIFYVLDKTLKSAVKKPTVQTTTTYGAPGTSLTQTEQYYYDNTGHMYPTRVVTTRSNGKTQTSYQLYPGDYAAGTGFIDALKTANIIAPPVENVVTLTDANGTFVIGGSISVAKNDATGLPDKKYALEISAPVAVSQFKFSNRATGTLPNTGTPTVYGADSRYQLKLTFNRYDSKGNPLTVTPENDAPVSYIWGYKQFYPVAEVKNATYENLETILGASALSTFSSGAAPTAAGVKSFLAPLRSSSALQKAMVLTNTYEPLVGVTSQQDVRNHETSYAYDSYKRLQLVKDYEGNILKQYEYSFVNPSFFNEQRSQTFTRNNCGPNFIGRDVTYTVPEGTYVSNVSVADANAQADAEITANGQTYANTNGTCYQYQNSAVSGTFTRECDPGLYGTTVTYTVPAGTYYSAISPQDAQDKAQLDLESNGQAYANANGTCLTYEQLHKNDYMSQTFQKYCGFGEQGSTLFREIAANTYTSTISKADANSKAAAALALGQQMVDNTGSCSALPTTSLQVSSSIYYDVKVVFRDAQNRTREFTLTPGTNYGSWDIPDGTYTVTMESPTSPTSYIYRYTLKGTQIQGKTATFNNVIFPGSNNQLTVTN